MAIYAKIKGQVQGDLTGAVTAAMYPGQIAVLTAEFGVGSAYDVATGTTTGKRVARPLVITKTMDQSTPLLHRACVTLENLTSIVISWVVEGQGHKPYLTLTLTNAMIRDFSSHSSETGNSVETIRFTYQKVELTWVDGGITSVDDWSAST